MHPWLNVLLEPRTPLYLEIESEEGINLRVMLKFEFLILFP